MTAQLRRMQPQTGRFSFCISVNPYLLRRHSAQAGSYERLPNVFLALVARIHGATRSTAADDQAVALKQRA